ncbi:hypothetical protein O7627_27370 [Solwaraspora sp. WMMD1047]|uniref:hypothetical protein n=1 Tax=Solwaraspora sp. WMMD1047 TaxID=3016102 RepID=UPI0024166B7C|nr:hypothetical protein [Solwaraspora sp. WMMD1047]MDG4832997.1 hypothetical protein [Solwaraspora sp. WMMD1047]
MGPVDAGVAERLIYDVLDERRLVPADGVRVEDWPDLFRRVLAVVRVGAMSQELELVVRT